MVKKEGDYSNTSRRSTVILFFVGAIVVPFAAAIVPMVMRPNKLVSEQQQNQNSLFFLAVGVSAALGLALYLYHDKKQQTVVDDNNGDKDRDDGISAPKQPTAAAKPKDIWKVGANNQNVLKKPKAAYNEKPFGSSYYYAHNDANTTGGYKDGLKMEDYRMNGPRLLSVNGLSVSDDDDQGGDNNGEANEEVAAVAENTVPAKKRITAQDPNMKNITKYLWDDSGNGKGIATIRVDVLPGDKLGEFVDWKDVDIKDVTATLPGEGLLAKIIVGENDMPTYQLRIDKLYGDAADVKVIIKPKRLLIKIYKKKHGFLSKNDNNLAAWPQPHRKI